MTGRNFTLTPPPSTRRRRLHVSPKCPCARRMVSCVSPHRRHAAVTAHQSGSLGKRMSKKKKDAEGAGVLHLPLLLSPRRQETPPILIYSRTILSNVFITLSPRPYLITLIYGEGGESVCFFSFFFSFTFGASSTGSWEAASAEAEKHELAVPRVVL